jgi:hypothetical protein
MLHKRRFIAALALASLISLQALAAEPVPPRVDCVPAGAVLVAELSRPEAVLDLVLCKQVVDAVQNTPQYKYQAEQPQFQQLLQWIRIAEASLGTDWQTALRKLTGGGITLAVTSGGGSLLIIDAKDENILRRFHELVLATVRGEAEKQKQPSPVTSKPYGELTQWSFGKEFHVLAGSRLLLSNQAELLHSALDLQAGRGKSIASQAPLRSARQALGQGATGTLLVDLEAVRKDPNVQAKLTQHNDPGAVLFFASVIDALKESSWLGLNLKVEKDKLTLNGTLDRQSTSDLSAFTLPKGKEGALPALAVPRQIACVSLYRDLKSFYTAKDTLFPERTSGIIFFENMMGIFFSGRQLTDEVFAEFQPEYRIVAAAQEFDAVGGEPETKLPAFALIIRLRHPKEFKDTAEEAWQKALGLINFTSGQKGQSGMIIDQDTYEGVKYHVARFTAPRGADKNKLPIQYNFRPTLVLMDEYFVLSSTEALARDLIVALRKNTAKPLAGVNSLVEFDAVQLAKVLESNRTGLVLQNMVQKGNAKEQAENEVGLFISLFKYLGRATLTLGTRDGKTVADLTIGLNLPEGGPTHAQ